MTINVTVGGQGGVTGSLPDNDQSVSVSTTGNIQVSVGGSRTIRSVPLADTTRPIVATGEKGSVITPDSVVLGFDTIGSYVQRIDAGPGIIVFPTDDTESANVVISHANTTTAVSTTTVAGSFLSNIGIDQFGHVISFEANNIVDVASTLETPRSITLLGTVTGTTTFDGSQDVTINIATQPIGLGSTDFSLGQDYLDIEGLNSIGVGDFTLSSSTLVSNNTIIIQSGGIVNLSNAKLENILDPTDLQDATTKAYVDSALDTLEADLLDVPTPTNPTDAANKAYVDELVQDVSLKSAALAATTGELVASIDPILDTLTTLPAPTLSIDGVTDWRLDDLLLVKDQVNASENGIYQLITLGDALNGWVFQRENFNNENSELPGSFIFITDGVINKGSGWVAEVDDAETFELRTDDINWVQFAGEGLFTAGNGLDLTGTTFSVNVDDTSIEIVDDALQLKLGGLSNEYLTNTDITIGNTAIILGGTTDEIRNLDLLTVTEIEGVNNRLVLNEIIIASESTGGFVIPVGSTIQRPPPEQGMIRYNTIDNRFEAYNGTAWTGLGGVVDVDQDTFVRAESTPGADNDQLEFFTGGVKRFEIGSGGDLTFGSANNQFIVNYTTGDAQINGNLDVSGDITLGGNIRVGDADLDTIEVIADFTSNLVPNTNAAFNLGSDAKNWDRLYAQVIDSNTESIDFDMLGSIIVPSGSTVDRPTILQPGMFRFNTSDTRFEAYDGLGWGGIGGVKDVDGDTYIEAETFPGADGDDLNFYTAGTQRMQINQNGKLLFGTNDVLTVTKDGVLILTGQVDIDQLRLDGSSISKNDIGPLRLESPYDSISLEPETYVSLNDKLIKNLADPIDDQDAVTKNYLENTFERDFHVLDGANTYTLSLMNDVDPAGINFGPSLIVYGDGPNQVSIELAPTGIDPDVYGEEGFIPKITVGADGRIISILDIPLSISANTVVDFTESITDVVGEAVRFNTEEGISVIFNDSNDTLDFYVNNFDINLEGDITGSERVIRNSNTTIATSITVDYLAGLTANNGIEIDLTPGVAAIADIRHGNTSSITDVINGPGTVINDITFDEFGHVLTVVSEDLNVNFVNVDGDSMTGPLTVPSIIDANNAAYFLNPDSTSELNVLNLTGAFSTANTITANGDIITTGNIEVGGDLIVTNDIEVTNNLSARIYYDADDPSYYADPASTSEFNALNLSGSLVAVGNITASQFIDSANNSYLLDPSGSSNLKSLVVEDDLISGRFVDADDNSFYVDPAGQSRLFQAIFGYGQSVSVLQYAIDTADTIYQIGTTGKLGWYNSLFQFAAYVDKAASEFVVPNGAIKAQSFVDTDDTQYFLNPAGTDSYLKAAIFETQINIGNNLTLDSAGISTNSGSVNLSPGNGRVNVNTSRVINVAEPTSAQDAATKFYVDAALLGGLEGLVGGDGLAYDANTFTFDVNVDTTTIEIVGDTLQLVNPFINITAEIGSIDILPLGETLNFAGGEGINTTVSNNEILIAAETASDTNLGVATFNVANFGVTAQGDVTVSEIDGGTF